MPGPLSYHATVNAAPDKPRRRVTVLAAVTAGLGLLALLAPLSEAEHPESRVGGLLAIVATVEALHSLRRSTLAERRAGTVSALISMAIALFLMNAPFVAAQALRIMIAGWFAVDAARYAFDAARTRDRRERALAALAALGNAAVVLLMVLTRAWDLAWVIALAGAFRIFGIAWNIIVAPVLTTAEASESVVDELGLADQPGAAELVAEIEAAERTRAPIDRGWTLSFIVTLFAIHIGRMSTDLTLLGVLSPAVAVAGDMLVAVLFTLLVFNPAYLLWRAPTRLVERPLWRRHFARAAAPATWLDRAVSAWLRFRLTTAIRMRELRYSVPATLNRGLQYGLPIAAILAATVPVWGMSWYFDTENWAAGMWNSWAESRTDTWREAMVRAVLAAEGGSAGPASFAVNPEGIGDGDFSFVVIGDTGEGDASQHVLRDQLLSVANSPDVRFVVISSDVVYPTGAMRDYEAKFWLPFKGVTRPVYAIPGNHDWYDALESFNATFLQPDAARASIRARVESDLRLTSTTEGRIEHLMQEAARLREAYRVPTGFQRAPFFEVQTSGFALLAIDTGVLQADRPGAGALARRRAAARRRQDDDGDRGTSLFRGRPRRDGGRCRVRAAETAAARPRRDDRHGRRHARSRVLPRAARPGPTRRAQLRQRRRGRLSELRHGAQLACAGAHGRLGALSGSAGRLGQDRSRHAVVEAAGLVVDDEVRRVAVFSRVAVGGVRLQRRAVLPELRRGEGGTVGTPRARRAVRRARPPDLGGGGRVRQPSPRCGAPTGSLVEWVIPMNR